MQALLLKKPVKSNVAAFPSFGVTRFFSKLSTLLKKLVKGNDVSLSLLW